MKKSEHISTTKVDGAGRIVIPVKLRKILNVKKNDKFTIIYFDGLITLKLVDEEKECYCCGKIEKNMTLFLGRSICGHCVKSVELAAEKIRNLYLGDRNGINKNQFME